MANTKGNDKDMNPQPSDPWWIIFERGHLQESPGAVFATGGFGGARQDVGRYRTIKPLLILQAPGWKQALEGAVKQTGRLGEFAAVECNVFTPDLLGVTGGTEGTDK